MHGIKIERATLISGVHHDRGQPVALGALLDKETASMLVRHQVATELDEAGFAEASDTFAAAELAAAEAAAADAAKADKKK